MAKLTFFSSVWVSHIANIGTSCSKSEQSHKPMKLKIQNVEKNGNILTNSRQTYLSFVEGIKGASHISQNEIAELACNTTINKSFIVEGGLEDSTEVNSDSSTSMCPSELDKKQQYLFKVIHGKK